MIDEYIDGEFEEQQVDVLSDDELVQLVMDEAAESLHGDDNDSWTTPAIDYYLGNRPVRTACKNPNASKIVSMDLHDAIEACVAEIAPAFGGGHVADFEAESEEDEEKVKVESDICNYLFMEQFNGLDIIVTGLKCAQLHRNCYARVYWDARNEVTYESFEGIQQEMVPQLLQQKAPDEQVEVIEHEEVEPPPEMVQQHQMMQQQFEQSMQQQMMMGQPPPQQPPQLPAFFDIRIRRTTVKSKPVIESMPPEQSMVNSDHQEVDLSNARFSCYRAVVMKSDLIQMGHDPDVIMDLPSYFQSSSQAQRNREGQTYNSAGRDATESVEVYTAYMRVDRDGDGIAELRRILVCENTLLDDEPCDTTDIVAGTGCIMPYAHEGVSAFDVQKDIQDGKTDLMRSVIDAAALGANPRVEADDSMVNLDDLLTSTTGGVVRSKRVGSVQPLPNPEVAPSVYSTLELFDKLRRERGGGAIDNASQAQQVGGDSAHGIERVMSSIEQRNAMVARTFGETFVRGIFLRLHALLRKYHQGQISAKIDGKWTTSLPSEWPARERVSITIGNSHGERLRMASALQGVQLIQKEMIAQGMPTTTAEKLYESSVDQAEYLGIPHAEKYYVDPASQEGQQLAQQQQEQQQQMQQKADETEQFQKQLASMQTQAQTTIAQAEMEKARVQGINNQQKNQIDYLKQQLEQAEAGSKARLEQEKLDRTTAMDLLKLEQEQQEQLDIEYGANKNTAENV